MAKRQLRGMARAMIAEPLFCAMLTGMPLPALRALLPWLPGGCFSLQLVHEHGLLQPLFAQLLCARTAEPAGSLLARLLLDHDHSGSSTALYISVCCMSTLL